MIFKFYLSQISADDRIKCGYEYDRIEVICAKRIVKSEGHVERKSGENEKTIGVLHQLFCSRC
jgi:hypothetical protein